MKKLILILIVFLGLFPQASNAALLYLIPQNQDIYKGDSFLAEIWLDTENEEVNAVGVEIRFPKRVLEVVGIKEESSVLALWPQKPVFLNDEGRLFFAGGAPKGFEGNRSIAVITFLAKEQGEAEVFLTNSSQVLLNDGQGTRAPVSFESSVYNIVIKPSDLPIIISKSHPDQTKWYSSNSLSLRWDLKENASYSYILSRDSLVKPDNIPDVPEGDLKWMGDMEYSGLEDGIYYFSLKEKITDWSLPVKFRAMIDTAPPVDFFSQIAEIDGKNHLIFIAQDDHSGIDYYEVWERKEWIAAESPYLLEYQKPKGVIKIKAKDRAGNENITKIVFPKRFGLFQILILILIIVALFIVLKKLNVFKAKK